MKKLWLYIGAAVLCLSLLPFSGCTSKGNYEKLQLEMQSAQAKIADMEAKMSAIQDDLNRSEDSLKSTQEQLTATKETLNPPKKSWMPRKQTFKLLESKRSRLAARSNFIRTLWV